MSDDHIRQAIQQSIRENEDIDERFEDDFIDILEAKYLNPEFDDESVTLSRMQIKGFRAISELDLPINNRATIVHGKNSKGKSSFIEAIRFNLLGRRENNPLVTDVIHNDYSKVITDGFWNKGSTDYKIHREMSRSQGYTGHEYPNIVESPEENQHAISQRQTQSEVNDIIGFTPLHQQGFDRFNVLSLFSVITGSLRSFYNSDDATDLIELLFGITLTNVERAVENEIADCELSDEEEEAKTRRLERTERANNLSVEIASLREDQEAIETELSQKTSKRDELSRLLDDKEGIDEDLTKKIEIKDEISILQSRRDEKQDEFRSVKQEISKLESEAVTEEIAPALQEMQQLVSLPNRCPICTADVSPDQHQQFHEEGDCPLCGSDVPEDRYESVSESDEEGEVLEHEERQEELKELKSRKRTVEGEIEFLENEIKDKKQQLSHIEESEDKSEFGKYKDRKQSLEEEIGSLKEQSRKLELRIETKRESLHAVARNVWKWTQLDEKRQKKEQRRGALKVFKNIISSERAEARDRLKNRLRQRMESLLDYFTHGTFEEATGVTFSKDDSYRYTIHVRDGSDLKPRLLEQTNAELTLHMLLFHTAILSELEKEERTIPLKLLLIDSPFGNGQDGDNATDITEFLLELPKILDNYQLIVAMADSNLTDQESLKQSFSLTEVDEYLETDN